MGYKNTQKPYKSFWQARKGHLWSFICPLCRVQRRIPFRPQPGGLRHGFQVGLTSLVFTLACWPWMGWKGLISFVPFWMGFEIFYRWRMRATLSCTQCGFDPYLFRIDLKRASREIETHWRGKFKEKGVPYPERPAKEIHP